MTDSDEALHSPCLILVPTPIGNLGDMTMRAVEALRDATHIAAEDTRRTRKLLSHLGLDARRLRRLDANATESDLQRVLGWMRAGESVALVTDAGTPSISDPGSALVRKAILAGLRITSLPGPSALTTSVALSGLVEGPFYFAGFTPRSTGEIMAFVDKLAKYREPCVLFESANRLNRTLRALADAMPQRQVMVARELSKLHEETVRGTLKSVAALQKEWIGEITVVLGPSPKSQSNAPTDEQVDVRIDAELAAGTHTRTVASKVAAWSGRPRRDVYARVIQRRDARR